MSRSHDLYSMYLDKQYRKCHKIVVSQNKKISELMKSQEIIDKLCNKISSMGMSDQVSNRF